MQKKIRNKKNQIAILIGTRPELIKMVPVMQVLEKRSIPYLFIHSKQHYSDELDQKIMNDLHLRKPDVDLHTGSGSHGQQTAKILSGVEMVCQTYVPKLLLVHGDTNTTLGGALAAKKMHIPVGHVEAGLRSFDLEMPEEVNRTLTDHISTILFAPTEQAKRNLAKEGISRGVYVTGNTIVDAVMAYMPLMAKSSILKRSKVTKEHYVLLTAHRPENVDDKDHLKKLFSFFSYAGTLMNQDVLYPIHPRTYQQVIRHHITVGSHIRIIKPVGYIDMLALIFNASIVMTDSGGIQEEAYILRKPLITVRNSTERPETMSANFLVDVSKEKLRKALYAYANKKMTWHAAFGDGHAGEKIVDTVLKKFF